MFFTVHANLFVVVCFFNSDHIRYTYIKLGCSHYGTFRGRGTGHRASK